MTLLAAGRSRPAADEVRDAPEGGTIWEEGPESGSGGRVVAEVARVWDLRERVAIISRRILVNAGLRVGGLAACRDFGEVAFADVGVLGLIPLGERFAERSG
jgi:hypothetical protein